MIKNHIDFGKLINKIQMEQAKADDEYEEEYWYSSYDCDEWDKWKLEETDDEIKGYTMMDNLSMEGFFRHLGIDKDDYEFKW